MSDNNGSLRGVFTLLSTLGRALLDLRLKPLPQFALIMLQERGEDLRAALRAGEKKTEKRRAQALERGWEEPAAQAGQTLAALRPLLDELSVLRRDVDADLAAAESIVRYNDFPRLMQALKQRLRGTGADTEKMTAALSPDQVLQNQKAELKEAARLIGQVDKTVNDLNSWADDRILHYCTAFAGIFDRLETDPVLADIHRAVSFELRAVAYRNIAESGLFDEPLYRSQLPDNGAGCRDCLKHYLMEPRGCSPCRLFDDAHYSENYPFVRMLRYSPLEHFVRYGEAMRLNPGPDLDVPFYLKDNDDVLEAGVSAYRHFVNHGSVEGRSPSPQAGGFFSQKYLDMTGGRLAFVGDPDDGERAAWELFAARCAEREDGCATPIPAADWTGNEDFDGFVVGASALASLDEERLSSLARNNGALVYLGGDPQRDLQGLLAQDVFPLTRICALTWNYEGFLRWQEGEATLRLLYHPFEERGDSLPVMDAVLSKLAAKGEFSLRRFAQPCEEDPARPVISVISIIYKKPVEMMAFLEAINRQDLARPYEVILVDDASPDDTVARIEDWLEEKRATNRMNRHMRVRILRNEVNSGNCVSRNRGIETAQAPIIVISDGDVLFSTASLSEHALAYRFGDCDAVIGFSLFDINAETAPGWLTSCEINEAIVKTRLLQPTPLSFKALLTPLNGYLNFVTRGVSFRKEALDGEYFDEDFAYSTKKDSGYACEDIEMGARLYFNGKKLRYLDRSVFIHMRHSDNSYSENKTIAALRNWNKLMAKYPDLALVERQFFQNKTADMLRRISSLKEAPEFREAFGRYKEPTRANITVRELKPLRVLTYGWDVPYLYELFKLNHRFTLVTGDPDARDGWAFEQRPLPRNARFAPLETIDPGEFDLAILPFDGYALAPEYCRSCPPERAKTFLTMLELTRDIPKIGLCHGAPPIYEGEPANARLAPGAVIPSGLESLRKLLGQIPVVCASAQARKEWGFADCTVIHPGLSPVEYAPGGHARGCLTLPRADFDDQPIIHGDAMRRRVEALLDGVCDVECAAPPPPHPGYVPDSPEWSVAGFQNRTAYIGDHKVFLNPTLHLPMPLIRAEAMMAGTVPVSLRNHDVDGVIENGVNGFCGDSAEELAEHVRWLLEHDTERREIGRRARLTAMDIFNVDRQLSAWNELIARTV
ncbi:glycosyltransferase [Pseudodesulfovibrio indicus]|uniref:glycosyltransferase n=1 Tax=Pseudodesulfovibrio indicus TaxID=1716143 RepID=UPI0029300C82|nr:glycosyltransferase [Pseudodesulfovibrio indicus]